MDNTKGPINRFRILIVGSAGPVNKGLGELIAEQPGLHVAAMSSTSLGAINLAKTLQPEVILFDLDTIGAPLPSVIGVFKQMSPNSVIILLAYDTTQTLRHHCKAIGISYVFNKTAELDELICQLHVLRREKFGTQEK